MVGFEAANDDGKEPEFEPYTLHTRAGVGHIYHKRCIRRWINTAITEFAGDFSCPLCRAGFENPNVKRAYDELRPANAGAVVVSIRNLPRIPAGLARFRNDNIGLAVPFEDLRRIPEELWSDSRLEIAIMGSGVISVTIMGYYMRLSYLSRVYEETLRSELASSVHSSANSMTAEERGALVHAREPLLHELHTIEGAPYNYSLYALTVILIGLCIQIILGVILIRRRLSHRRVGGGENTLSINKVEYPISDETATVLSSIMELYDIESKKLNASSANASSANASSAKASFAKAPSENASFAKASFAKASSENASSENASFANASFAKASSANASFAKASSANASSAVKTGGKTRKRPKASRRAMRPSRKSSYLTE